MFPLVGTGTPTDVLTSKSGHHEIFISCTNYYFREPLAQTYYF